MLIDNVFNTDKAENWNDNHLLTLLIFVVKWSISYCQNMLITDLIPCRPDWTYMEFDTDSLFD